MPVSELLTDGVTLMLVGMGIVFTFLLLLVVTMTGMSNLAKLLEEKHSSSSGGSVSAAPGHADETLVAVITAAVRQYRETRRK